MPTRDCCRVLGIGVAERVIMSIFGRVFLIISLCRTPKRCSSSTIKSPSLGTITSGDKRRCVPTRRSIKPPDSFSRILFCSGFVLKRDKSSISTPRGPRRSLDKI